MLVGVGAVVGAGVAGIAVQANAISATSASDMAVSNCMAVVYTIKAWSKLRPMMTSKNIFLFLAVVALVLVAICTATQPS
ncbi:uncharacterized protein METZ01_LOCUS146850 [marine metagenome]|uniref:Uncharacterized protein n=1 Tax=marine metagenome TaxID=408172 RepID=A0A381ZXK6_9ZZZZ